MHEPAGVVENLVQILQFTPILQYRIPLPPEMKIVRNIGTLTFQLQNTPPPENRNLGRPWHFVIFLVQITPPPENWNLGRSWHFVIFQVQITPPPPKIET